MTAWIGKSLALASWVAFAVGLYLTDKFQSVSLEGAAPPPLTLQTMRLDAEEALAVTGESTGEAEVRIVLHAIDETEAWLAANNDRDFRIELRDENSSVTLATANAADFGRRGDFNRDDVGFFVAWVDRLPIEEAQEYRLRATLVGTPPRAFRGFGARLELGPKSEQVTPKNRKTTRASFVLLAGALGAFIHLFLLFIHLIVPFCDALPPEE
ncbi:MAG: hypothetical protein KDB53_16105 [Planctomycetes bacterium]|nr:hypothetical protein [Planctomycetota bacterium]